MKPVPEQRQPQRQSRRRCVFLHHFGVSTHMCVLALMLAGLSQAAFAWSEAVLYPDKDNTLYETDMDAPGDPNEVSNGVGSFLFAGRTNIDAGFRLRRGLIHFDLAGIPSGSQILSAELVLYQSQISPNAFPVTMSLHRALEDWGEAGSDGIGPEGQGAPALAGDATWYHSFYDTVLWTQEGGVFAPSASASATVGLALQDYGWNCSPAMVADLQDWLDNPGTNSGWVLLGNEDAGGSVRRFNSVNNAEAGSRPRLRLIYQSPEDVFADGFEAATCSD
ncbi:MAG TPA: hypothetical protein VFG52_11620 [Xanthomonadales bacterium]|nr:hypothetical protein [Xanthomonadales bacterium]